MRVLLNNNQPSGPFVRDRYIWCPYSSSTLSIVVVVRKALRNVQRSYSRTLGNLGLRLGVSLKYILEYTPSKYCTGICKQNPCEKNDKLLVRCCEYNKHPKPFEGPISHCLPRERTFHVRTCSGYVSFLVETTRLLNSNIYVKDIMSKLMERWYVCEIPRVKWYQYTLGRDDLFVLLVRNFECNKTSHASFLAASHCCSAHPADPLTPSGACIWRCNCMQVKCKSSVGGGLLSCLP